MENNNKFKGNKQLEDLKGKKALISLKNQEEFEGKIISIDKFLNTVLEIDNNLKIVKGRKIIFISIKD